MSNIDIDIICTLNTKANVTFWSQKIFWKICRLSLNSRYKYLDPEKFIMEGKRIQSFYLEN